MQTIELEIQSTFKALKINLNEIKPNGLIDCMSKPLTSCTSAMRKEIDYLHKRQKLILPPTAITSLSSGSAQPDQISNQQNSEEMEQALLRQ